MPTTTAKVEHRDYVPWGWIAIKFCKVKFYGFRAKEMEKKWGDIESNRYITYNSLYEKNEIRIQNMHNKASAIHKQIKASKPFYRFWHNKVEKEMLSEANKLSNQAYELEKENEEVGNKRLFDVFECHTQIENLLQQNGFVLTSTSSSGNECVTKIEVWTLEE